MTRPAEAFVPTLPPSAGGPVWQTLSVDEALQLAGAGERRGLSSAGTAVRADRSGPDTVAGSAAGSRWHALIRPYTDSMQIVLLAAGICSLYPVKQPGTGLLLIYPAAALPVIMAAEIRKARLRRPIRTVAGAGVRAPLAAAAASGAFP